MIILIIIIFFKFFFEIFVNVTTCSIVAKIEICGLKMNLGYRSTHLGASPDTISALADGTHPFCERKYESFI